MSTVSSAPIVGLKTNLRRPVTFVGRKSELEKILDALASSTRAWIISLTGVGGIGKTELAVQAAHFASQMELFESVIWTTAKESWLTPQGIESKKSEYAVVSLEDLLRTAISVLELDPQVHSFSLQRKKQLVNKALRATSCLLIVDNLETVKDREIIEFLEELPAPSKALVTTRLGGLTASDVPVSQTMEGQREIRIGPLDEDDAIDLFINRAADRELHFSREHHLSKLREAVNKAAYIPLAIEWVVGQMVINGRTFLDEALNRLRHSDGEVLKYCFDSLISAVGNKAKKVLLAIPIFAKSASLEALSDVVVDMTPGSRDEALQRLTAASLLELEDDGRYSVLAPTRLYVGALWRGLPDLYRDYHLRTANYYVQLLKRFGNAQRWKSIEDEYHNILAIFSWCYENGYFEQILDLAEVSSSYFQRLGLWDYRIQVCQLARVAAENLGRKKEIIDFAYDAAQIHKHRERFDDALTEFQRCEQYSEETGDKSMAADSRMQIAVVHYHKGEYPEAKRILQQSLEGFRSSGNEKGAARAQSLLGRVDISLNNLDEAERYLKGSLELKAKDG